MGTTRYTLQLWADSGNWGNPEGSDVKHADNKREAAELVRDWAETVGRYDDERQASALVWRGDLDDVTDLYPDYQVTIGPRLGVVWAHA
jgi:hypothetical protein